MSEVIFEQSLAYHEYPTPGKLTIKSTKKLDKPSDLALAYSPGVSAPCLAIVKNPGLASKYTSRGNLVAVVSNGSAVLGLGNIGPLASKPVMEGKAVLFKAFSGIDVFDLEIDESDPEELAKIVAKISPTVSGINLEDIKAPECFIVEEKAGQLASVPVFHDDQHGTAIVVAAALINALELVGKKIEDIKLIVSGAGAAATACLELLFKFGLSRKNVLVSDGTGIIYTGRDDLAKNPRKEIYAQTTKARTLEDGIEGADVFLGLSVANVLSKQAVAKMAPDPIILALANPIPEILPEVAKEVRPDAIIATGRSDYPNQINNVLCFPFIFRGALDAGASCINDEMKMQCAIALSKVAKLPASREVKELYPGENLVFGKNYIIPKPFDSRLLTELSWAVAKTAKETKVAGHNCQLEEKEYKDHLKSLTVPHTNFLATKDLSTHHARTSKVSSLFICNDDFFIEHIHSIIEDGIFPILLGDQSAIKEAVTKDHRIKAKDYKILHFSEASNEKMPQGILKASDGKTHNALSGMIEEAIKLIHKGIAKSWYCNLPKLSTDHDITSLPFDWQHNLGVEWMLNHNGALTLFAYPVDSRCKDISIFMPPLIKLLRTLNVPHRVGLLLGAHNTHTAEKLIKQWSSSTCEVIDMLKSPMHPRIGCMLFADKQAYLLSKIAVNSSNNSLGAIAYNILNAQNDIINTNRIFPYAIKKDKTIIDVMRTVINYDTM